MRAVVDVRSGCSVHALQLIWRIPKLARILFLTLASFLFLGLGYVGRRGWPPGRRQRLEEDQSRGQWLRYRIGRFSDRSTNAVMLSAGVLLLISSLYYLIVFLLR